MTLTLLHEAIYHSFVNPQSDVSDNTITRPSDWNAAHSVTGAKATVGWDSDTHERGFLVKIVNRTGHASVKGELVSCSTSANEEAILQNNEYDTIGIAAQTGISEGSEMWVWSIGSICQVLFKDGQTSTAGNILLAADTDGRAYNISNPGSGLPAVETHFKECGHVLETKGAGTDVLVLASIHFN